MANLLKLYENPRKIVLWAILGISLLGFLILNSLMSPIETYLKSISPYGVLDLEFIWTADKAAIIVAAWGSEGINRELYVTYLDFGYLVCYSTFFAALYLVIIRALHNRQLLNSNVENKVAMGVVIPYIAAFLDLIENINIVIILTNPSNIQDLNAFLTSFCATLKFGLLLVALVSIILSALTLIIKKK